MLIVTYAFYDVNLYLVPQNKLGWVIILNKFILSIFIFWKFGRRGMYKVRRNKRREEGIGIHSLFAWMFKN